MCAQEAFPGTYCMRVTFVGYVRARGVPGYLCELLLSRLFQSLHFITTIEPV
jgi:hypothetical protein